MYEDALAEARRRAGPELNRGHVCFGCCIEPFPITLLDAEHLRRGLELLDARGAEPERIEPMRVEMDTRRAGEAASAESPHPPNGVL